MAGLARYGVAILVLFLAALGNAEEKPSAGTLPKKIWTRCWRGSTRSTATLA